MARWDWLRWIRATHNPENTQPAHRGGTFEDKGRVNEGHAVSTGTNAPNLRSRKWRAQRTSTSIEVNTSRWRILFMSDQPEPTMVEPSINHWANQELMAICMG